MPSGYNGPKIPIPGGGGSMSTALRVGAGAARVLAGATVVGGLALGLQWFAEHCFEKRGDRWVWTCSPNAPKPSTGKEYITNWDYDNSGAIVIWYSTPQEACQVGTDKFNAANGTSYVFTVYVPSTEVCRAKQGSNPEVGLHSMRTRAAGCPAGWYSTPDGCVQSPPPEYVTPEQVVDHMSSKPLPQRLPSGVPYPLDPDRPIIINPDPANPGNPLPLKVPQGSPKPVPDTQPQRYEQPTITITPTPTKEDPTRVDVKPGTESSESPEGLPGPTPVGPGAQPSGPRDPEDPPDLCEKHPDVLACQKLKPGELEPQRLENKNVPLAINAEGGFPSGGACPAPRSVSLLGQTFEFSMQAFCDFATAIKPLLIGFAWLMAAMTFLGVARREG